jgi:hypothetical protein
MSDEQGTLRLIAEHLVSAVAPLDLAFRDADAFRALMWRLGWDAHGLPPSYAATADKAMHAVQAVEVLADNADASTIIEVIEKVSNVYAAINTLAIAPPGVDPGTFLPEIGRRLFEYLLIEYLRDRFPALLMGFEAVGSVSYEDVPAVGTRPGFTRTRFDWEALADRLSDPTSIPAEVYGWGTDDLKFGKVAEIFSELFIALGFHVSIDQVDRSLSDAYQFAASGTPKESINLGISVAIFDFTVDDTYHDVGFRVLELPAEGSALPGMIVQPLVPHGLVQSIDLTSGWTFNLRAGTDLANQFGIVLRPDETGVRYPFAPGTPFPSAGFGAAVIYQSAEPFRIFGDPDGIRLEGKAAKFLLDLDVKQGQPELRTSVVPEELTFVLKADDLDGFLGSVIGGGETRIPFPLRLSWSNRTGLDFVAGLGFEVSVYPHLDIEVLCFDRVDLGVRSVTAEGEPAKLELRVACALSGALGPIAYSADGVGVHLPVTFAPGNAGPFDIGFGVLLPNAIGIVIDSGPVSGGGFIQRDPDKGRYCGMLELSMFDIDVAATGVLETKDAQGEELPPPGYSLFIAVSAEFSPIQLGYGFTLNGVGGLAAVHRRVNVDAVSSRLREGVLDGVMFPKDPVVNAPAIISNLTTVFPIAMNRYVFGPMAIIGWGTPNLVRAEIAVLLEVPEPVLLVILGQASIVIPPEAEEAVIEINVDFVGVLDYASSSFALDATLRDSTVAGVAITGDMAMRLVWAGKRNLVIAIGGVHPHFTPPPGFPSLRRISMALGSDNPRITIEAYYALTANSRQFGAKAELYAAAAGFSVHGWLFFDSLFTIMPLWFRIDFDAGMTLNRGSRRIAGITVRGALTGPAPFHAWGEGRLSLLFFDVCVPFDVTFGPHRVFELLGRDPWPLLKTAIESAESWVAEIGRGVAAAASMRPAPPGGPALLLHPMGAATLRQHVLPLNRPLERFGEFAIEGPDRFDVTTIRVGQDEIANSDWSIAEDEFAPGDFEALSETDRLSRDSFERMAAGVAVGGDLVDAPQNLMKVAKVAYETRIIDEGAPGRVRVLPTFDLPRAVQLSTGGRGAKVRSLFVRSGRAKFAREAARPLGVTLGPETYAVATTDTLVLRADIVAPTTSGAARLAVKSEVGRGARGLQVVPTHELESAA